MSNGLLADYGRRRDEPVAAALAGLRARSRAAFDRSGLPTVRIERWKYTSLAPLDLLRFDAPPAVAHEPIPPLLRHADRILLDFGAIDRAASRIGALPDGVVLDGIAAAPQSVRDRLGSIGDATREPLLALNGALAEDVLVLSVPDGVALPRPIELVLQARAGAASYPRLLVVLGRGASATLVEHHVGAETGFVDLAVEIALGEGARFRQWRLQVAGAAQRITTVAVTATANASYRSFTLGLGGRLIRNQTDARIEGAGAEIEIDAACMLAGDSHVDTTTRVVHAAPNGRSRQTVKSVLDGHSRSVFQGKIEVTKAAQKTDGYQLSRALLLSPDAEIDVKPELEIYADDVKCSHGATTGRLDEEALFYLRSRGIPHDEARGLLIEAFVAEAILRIDDEAVRSCFLAAAATRLAFDELAGLESDA